MTWIIEAEKNNLSIRTKLFDFVNIVSLKVVNNFHILSGTYFFILNCVESHLQHFIWTSIEITLVKNSHLKLSTEKKLVKLVFMLSFLKKQMCNQAQKQKVNISLYRLRRTFTSFYNCYFFPNAFFNSSIKIYLLIALPPLLQTKYFPMSVFKNFHSFNRMFHRMKAFRQSFAKFYIFITEYFYFLNNHLDWFITMITMIH